MALGYARLARCVGRAHTALYPQRWDADETELRMAHNALAQALGQRRPGHRAEELCDVCRTRPANAVGWRSADVCMRMWERRHMYFAVSGKNVNSNP